MPPAARSSPFRLAIFGLFVAFATLYVALVARGIIVSLMHQGMLPLPHTAGECRRAPDSCARGIAELRAALDAKSCELERTGTAAERLWDDWAQSWERDLAGLKDECCLTPGRSPPERERLQRAAADLERLGQLYTTHLVQYAREIGPQAERCASDLAVILPADQAPTTAPPNP